MIIVFICSLVVCLLFYPYRIHLDVKIQEKDVSSTLTFEKNCFLINCLFWKKFYIDAILNELEKRNINYTKIVSVSGVCYKGWKTNNFKVQN